jgi:ketosteroid isomerase-like protein
MTERKADRSRRSFFLQGGAALGAGVAAAGAAALMPDAGSSPDQLRQLRQQLDHLGAREAIRQLHLAFTSLVESQAYEAAAELFTDDAHLQLSGLSATGKPAIRRQFANQYRQQQAAALHTAYRQSALQQQDVVTIGDSGLSAAATFHADVELSTPLPADSTAAQMARLQGQVADRRWQAGRFNAQYVKLQGEWRIASLRYLPS